MIENAQITVEGTVQGVGYRWYADRTARKYDLKGFVENRTDGSVYLEVEGEKDLVERLIDDLKAGPKLSHVTSVAVKWGKPHHLFINFKIKA